VSAFENSLWLETDVENRPTARTNFANLCQTPIDNGVRIR